MAHERVGKRVRVYWSEEEEWFEGTIQELNQSQGYYIVYDDGDERWESEGQPMLVEGEEEAQTAANYEELRMEQSKSHQQPEDTTNHTTGDEIQQQHEVINYSEDEVDQDTYQQEKEEDQQDHSQSESKDDHAENGIEDHGGEDVDDASDDQSVAESEMPETFGKTNETTGKHRLPSTSTPPSTVPVPVKGMLEGRVLRATGLQTSRALAPNAFVRVSFVESGDATHASAMLRCKETLSTTGIVRGSVNPVWSEDLLSDDNQHSRNDSGNGGFQLELLPRIVPPGTKPAWHQLPGDVLFTIFSASRSDGSRNGANEHIGQATISLRSLLQDLLTVSPFTTRVLELRSRSGKRLGYGNTSTRSLFDDGRAEAPTLVASFKFIPTYESKINRKAGYRQDKAKRTAPAQTSSSCINRRRFEKQVAKDNRSFAKRLEWKEARRTRRSAQAKAQEKKKVTPPQYGARNTATKLIPGSIGPNILNKKDQHQELELDKEMNDQQSKWEYAIATQLFHRQMDKKNAIQAQQAVLEMKRRLKALELSREEEEQWVCYQARQELTQLQFAIQILRDQNGEGSRGLAETRASKSSSTAVCEYLTKKIEKQKSKLQQLQDEVGRRRNDYEVMLVSGGNESLRRRVQELQKLVFLCKSQATHVKKAERIAKRKGEQVDMEFQRRLFSEQTETEIMFKRVPKQ
ncbi:Tudor domain [Phytophthora cactorum]|nr:Tudor domain [Phytophthora cactorum]